ncbi:hypothetical protein PMIN05_001509 [Paraphaeosphaeria minitans]
MLSVGSICHVEDLLVETVVETIVHCPSSPPDNAPRTPPIRDGSVSLPASSPPAITCLSVFPLTFWLLLLLFAFPSAQLPQRHRLRPPSLFEQVPWGAPSKAATRAP